jgi:hypothetical protein
MSNGTPSPKGEIVRRTNGQFGPGHCGGPGNPYARRVADLRGEILAQVSDE